MTENTLTRTIELLLDHSRALGPRLEVLWHAGEPLIAGLPFYIAATALLNKLSSRTEVVQTFQTNGTLITKEWCRFFLETGAEVGISIDGPREIHDRRRRTRRGAGSFDATMRGLSCLISSGIDVSALAVITSETLCRAREVFEFFLAAGVSAVGFNVEEVEGENEHSSLLENATDLELRFRGFMEELLDLNLAHGSPLWIRESQASVQALLQRRADLRYFPIPAETQRGRILTITRDGDICTFSPELASGRSNDPSAFVLGNVHTAKSLAITLNGEKAREIQAAIDEGNALCEATCSYFGICGGGSPANKVYENGSFVSTSTIKCRLQTRAMADLLLDLSQTRPVTHRTQTAQAR